MAKMKGFGELGAALGMKINKEKSSLPPPPKNQATAPYNFVSLPNKVLPAQFENVEDFGQHVSATENISGEISLKIETLTPLFIGGGQGSKSFAPVDDTPIIPGSSLRGMIKNIFKIVTCGAFRGQTDSQKKGEDFNDEHIYFRCLMKNNNAELNGYNWSEKLHEVYVNRMVREAVDKDGKKHHVKNARPGFLIHKTNGQYFIAPSIYMSDRPDDFITIKAFQKKYGAVKFRDSRIHWDGKIAYIVTGNQWANKPERFLDKAAYKKFKEDLQVLREKKDAGKISEAEFNDEARKYGKQIIRYTDLDYIEPNREKWFAVPDEVLSSYRHDRNRKGVDLLRGKYFLSRDKLEKNTGKDFPDVDTIIPCHFLTKKIADDKKIVTAFGHGQCFRIPYENRIGELVKILGNDSIDFADAVFGKEKFWASRVYFEDAMPEKFSELPTETAHLLMQPNPTSYQLYLKQGDRELKYWDASGAQIRGYKLYWHKPADDWKISPNEDRRLAKEMTPLAKGSKFTAKIRFKNLSAEELGAFMMVFDLNGHKNSAYKIGMGKPFGFGSVKITPTLFVESNDAYTKLFDGDSWKNPCRQERPDIYLKAFRKYLVERKMDKAWQKIMNELKMILDWSPAEQKGWSDWVKSMNGNVTKKGDVDRRFIQRAPLPKIESIFEVVK